MVHISFELAKSTNNKQVENDTPPRPEASTSEIVLGEMTRSVEYQTEQYRNIDNKAGFVLTSATLVVGLFGLTANESEGFKWGLTTAFFESFLIGTAFVLYATLVASVFLAYRPRLAPGGALSPQGLRESLGKPLDDVRREFVFALEHIHSNNRAVVDTKLRWLLRSLHQLIGLVVIVVFVTLLRLYT